jgi:hypothetical protein
VRSTRAYADVPSDMGWNDSLLMHMWFSHIHNGLGSSPDTPATLRDLLLNIPARLVRRARKRLIRLPDNHPHAADLILAWNKIRAVAAPP